MVRYFGVIFIIDVPRTRIGGSGSDNRSVPGKRPRGRVVGVVVPVAREEGGVDTPKGNAVVPPLSIPLDYDARPPLS